MRHCACHASSARSVAEPQRPRRPHRTAAPSRSRLLGLFACVAAVGYAVDVTHQDARGRAARRARARSRSLGPWFGLHLTRNPGAAFSTGTAYTEACSAALDRRRRASCSGSAAGSAARCGRSRSAALLAGVAGNLTDRMFREPGPLRGHVDRLPAAARTGRSSTSPTSASTSPPGVIILQAFRGIGVDGTARQRSETRPSDAIERDDRAARRAGARGPRRRAGRRRDGPDVRALPHPGRRPDRRRATSQVDGAVVGKSDRVHPGAMLDVTIPAADRPARGRPRDRRGDQDHPRRRRHRGDRQAGRRRRAPQPRLARPDRGRPPRRRRLPDLHQRRLRAPGHRAAARRRHVRRDGDLQVRARLLACSRTPSATARSTRPTTRSCRATPTRSRAPSTPRSAGTRKADYKFAVMADGKHSVTHYETLEAHRFASLLEVHLETGRTHQIRVHMAALKHPCVGDLTYGADPVLAKRVGLERQWLHAVRLGFEHPETGEYVEYESTLPRRPGRTRWRSSAMSADSTLTLRPATPERPAGGRRALPRRPRGAVPAMPPVVHPADDVRRLGRARLGPRPPRGLGRRDRRRRCVGFADVQDDWLDDLYVAPDARRRGHRLGAARPGQGACARRLLPVGLRDQHPGARRSTRATGCVELERTDGSANEERAPDVRMAWPGADPLAFFRGLIDDVDDQLGDLLARRAALTARRPGAQAGRRRPDRARPDREREIARRDGRPRPELGARPARADRARDHHRVPGRRGPLTATAEGGV